jgi:transitional endoplasmic reticulum ATPase
MSLPKFLTQRNKRQAPKSRLNETTVLYRPLLGPWLIKIALMLHWYDRDPDERWPELLRNAEFLAVTGLTDLEPPSRRARPTAAFCRGILTERLSKLEEEDIPQDLPLFNNLQLFAQLLDLNEAEQAVLLFVALFDLFPAYREVVASRSESTSDHLLWRILNNLTGIPEQRFRVATGGEGILVSAGLLKVDHSLVDLENKVDLMEGLSGILLVPHGDVEELMARFLRRAAPPSLTLDNFPHLAKDTQALQAYLENALQRQTTGVNILLAGKAGVGKTEYAQALACALGAELYEISYSGPDGEPIKGESRLRAYGFCQRLLARSENAILMFDEIEDVFPANYGFLSLLFGSDDEGGKQTAGKAWINRTMEQNQVPAFWISNRTRHIDDAYRRRFDYSMIFPTPPRSVRLTIARHHLGCLEPPIDWLERIAANEELTPAQLERAAKVALIAAGSDRLRAMELVEQTLQRSITLLGQRRTPSRNRVRTGYDVAWLNTDCDIERLISGLGQRPQGSFCFYGAAGTGKSELARQIADRIDKPILMRRASDLLNKYVGESEKNIATMFEDAAQQDAVLVLDEADSFLTDRRGAHQSWEVTQVNELLTQMEAFEGIFICTSNLLERLDQASLRRFSFKVRFNPLTPTQRWGLFRQELRRLGGKYRELHLWEAQVRKLEGLTPGDFAVVARQFELWGTPPTARELYKQLRSECDAKEGATSNIGF